MVSLILNPMLVAMVVAASFLVLRLMLRVMRQEAQGFEVPEVGESYSPITPHRGIPEVVLVRSRNPAIPRKYPYLRTRSSSYLP